MIRLAIGLNAATDGRNFDFSGFATAIAAGADLLLIAALLAFFGTKGR